MKFEKQTRHVVYSVVQDIYRVSWDPVHANRTFKDPGKHLVGIAAALAFWDMVDRHDHCLGCARTVKAAWDAGDRYLLDTDAARQAAELVSDLSVTKPADEDICSALTDLLNAIAPVRLSQLRMEDFEVLPVCTRALASCLEHAESSWTPQARKRRFLYALKQAERTPLIYTLMSLYFNHGSTPLLTTRQRQELLALPRGEGLEGGTLYFDNCLRAITAYRFA